VVSDDTTTTDLTFTVPSAEFKRAMAILGALKSTIRYAEMTGAQDVVKVSAIGVGMRSHTGVAARAFRALADKGVNIRAITTSEIKFSVLIDEAYAELAVRTLHTLYGLDARG
jgi:aspartate kinase